MFFRASLRRLFPVACATVMLCASAVAHVPRAPVPRAPSVGETDKRIGFVDFDADGDARLYYYLVDHQQTVLQIVDSAGAVVNTYDYDAYGNVAWDSANVATNVPNRYLFQGREWDEHAGHYYYRYRTGLSGSDLESRKVLQCEVRTRRGRAGTPPASERNAKSKRRQPCKPKI